MIKFLEVPDFHFSPKWADVSKQAGDAVLRAACERAVDFIAIPGDLYDAPIMATDKGGINALRAIIKNWVQVCPVVAVQGTPSHDGPGCYGILEDLGITLLQPGIAYRFNAFPACISPLGTQEPDCLLFGIPELNKQTIQSQLSLNAEQANAEATILLDAYIADFIAPMRLKHQGIPAVGLLHGNVSDSHRDNETDIILRASDIVIHTESLMQARLDRWSLGHIHTPWESSVICAGYAGYAGIDSNPWGKRDFVPAMNLVRIESGTTSIERIPYGTPERRKISKPLASYDPAVAYWLVSDDADAQAPGGHPWSRITYEEHHKETRRVSSDQASQAKTLGDLFKLIDPKGATQDILDLVDTIPQQKRGDSSASVDLAMTYLKVAGCSFFGGKTIEFDLASLPSGVTAIRGDNGAGKSSLLAFCSPYPVIIGKDTSSGRPSAIKDFFSAKDSMIEKRFTVNGAEHRHLITIRGAHTQSPKTECYLYIDGTSQLDCGTFDEMMEACERIYGPYSDYLLTSFYVQPLQGKTGSSLMSATMTDIRNLVQSIAGIDREAEKRFALDRQAEAEKQCASLASWIAGSERNLEDVASLEASKQASLEQSQEASASAKLAQEELADEQGLLEFLLSRQALSNSERERKMQDMRKLELLEHDLSSSKSRLDNARNAALELANLRLRLDAAEKASAHNREVDEAIYRNRMAERAVQEKLAAYKQSVADIMQAYNMECMNVDTMNRKAKLKHETDRDMLYMQLDSDEQRIKHISARIETEAVPCPQCGYVSPDIAKRTALLKSQLAEIRTSVDATKDKIKAMMPPVQVPHPPKPELPQKPTDEPILEPVAAKVKAEDGAHIRLLITNAERAKDEIASIKADIEHAKHGIAEIEQATYDIDDGILQKVELQRQSIATASSKLLAYQRTVAQERAHMADLDARIQRSLALAGEIAQAKEQEESCSIASSRWRYIASMLQPSKIPALELDLMLDSIDAEASRILEAYQEGRFAIETETQSTGKAGQVDRFDILVHDSETGEQRSFMKYSPGQKAFFSDAYVKALVRQRNERAHRSYKPVIMDESDGPIQPELVASYYEMQRRYWTDCPVLAVSHSPASHEHIEHSIDIQEIKK